MHWIESLENRTLLSATLPRPDHVLVVVEENHSYNQIIQEKDPSHLASTWAIVPQNLRATAPHINSLARHGANLRQMFAETHPSQPNYLALFSGSTQGVTSDATGSIFNGPSLGGQLHTAGLSFAGYSEDQPTAGYLGDKYKDYARKHNPWSDFADVPQTDNQPFSAFPHDFNQLPTVSFVIPNQQHDMHSGPIRTADKWLDKKLRHYRHWARKHNSLLIVTWDEGSGDNHIPTVFYGPMVKKGNYDQPVNHFNVLRTIEDMYGLSPIGQSATAEPITGIFKRVA